jgi:DNA primase
MSQNFSDFVAEVKERADIVRIISRYLPLKKSGSRYVGVCPFHNDHKPSMYVTPQMGIYKCFVCGAGGDVFKFLQEHDKLSFRDSLNLAAEDAGLGVPAQFSDSASDGYKEKNQLILEANGLAAEYFQSSLKKSKEVQKYLEVRGISEKVQKFFQVGLAPDAWEGLLSYAKKKGLEEQTLVEAGLIKEKSPLKKYDNFRNRLMFPIWNLSSRIVAFGGRTLDENIQPKYLNSPESPLYQKSKILYGFNFARSKISASGEAVLVEGYMDVLALKQAGLDNATAVSGTALTDQHAELLAKFTRKVYLFFDGDNAGRQAALRCLPILLKYGLEIKIPQLPLNEDPDSFATKYGGEKVLQLLNSSLNIVEFLVQDYSKQKSAFSPEEKNHLYKSSLYVINNIEADPVRKDYIRQLNKTMELPFNANVNQKPQTYFKKGRSVQAVSNKPASQPQTGPEWLLIQLLLSSDKLCGIALEKLQLSWITDDFARDLADRITAFYEEEGGLNLHQLLERLPEKQRAVIEIVEILEFVDFSILKTQFIDIITVLEKRYIQRSMKEINYLVRNRKMDKTEGLKQLKQHQERLKALNSNKACNISD